MTAILSDEAIRTYHDKGYYLARGFFDAEEIDLLRRSAKEDHELDKHAFGRADGEGGVVRLSLWNHPGEGIYGMFARCERMVRWRVYVFYVPWDQQRTRVFSIGFARSRYPGPTGGLRLIRWLFRRELDREIRNDVAILHNLASYETGIAGLKLGRFDKVLGLTRERIERIYRRNGKPLSGSWQGDDMSEGGHPPAVSTLPARNGSHLPPETTG